MATRELTATNFEEIVTGNDIVLVDFWASWCGPCRQFAPVFEAASEQHPDVVFGKVDTEAERSLAAQAQITSIPTLMAFREQTLVFAQPGALPPAALEQVIDAVKGLDMAEVHRQVAQAEQAEQAAEISVVDLAEKHAAGAFVLDVREPAEYASGHVPGAVLIPMNEVANRRDEIPSDGPVYVICRSGNRSRTVCELLGKHGVSAVNVAGGTEAWKQRGYVIAEGPAD